MYMQIKQSRELRQNGCCRSDFHVKSQDFYRLIYITSHGLVSFTRVSLMWSWLQL